MVSIPRELIGNLREGAFESVVCSYLPSQYSGGPFTAICGARPENDAMIKLANAISAGIMGKGKRHCHWHAFSHFVDCSALSTDTLS